jgi:hypothetical protein
MSGGTVCRCGAPRSAWEVIDYRCNYSYFNGRRYTPSDYSAIHCTVCRAHWRTKAAYVIELRHMQRSKPQPTSSLDTSAGLDPRVEKSVTGEHCICGRGRMADIWHARECPLKMWADGSVGPHISTEHCNCYQCREARSEV